jgi:hypothetical protein
MRGRRVGLQKNTAAQTGGWQERMLFIDWQCHLIFVTVTIHWTSLRVLLDSPTIFCPLLRFYMYITGVWIRVWKHSPDWRVVKNFHSPGQRTTDSIYRNCQWEGNSFTHQLPEFYSHLAIWRVVNRTPDIIMLIWWNCYWYSGTCPSSRRS